MTREEFLKDVTNFSNHRYLLWEALEETKGDIVEFGMGFGSTPFLRQYAIDSNRHLFSYENNLDWFEKFPYKHCDYHEMMWLSDWDEAKHEEIDVLLIDHAPGERRKVDIQRFADIAKIIVVHDSEPIGWNSSDYQVRPLFSNFKYVKDLKSDYSGGAWATVLSNEIDVRKWQL